MTNCRMYLLFFVTNPNDGIINMDEYETWIKHMQKKK